MGLASNGWCHDQSPFGWRGHREKPHGSRQNRHQASVLTAWGRMVAINRVMVCSPAAGGRVRVLMAFR